MHLGMLKTERTRGSTGIQAWAIKSQTEERKDKLERVTINHFFFTLPIPANHNS